MDRHLRVQGYDIVSGPVSLPSGDTVTPAGESTYTWTTMSSDPRALQVPGSTNRVAAVWYASTSFTVDVNLGDGAAHNLELYFDDWDSKGRSETVQLSDAGTGKVLDTETISAFTAGAYLDWKVSGNLLITITRTAGANAVLNGLFLDGTTSSSIAIQTADASGGEAGVPTSVSTADWPEGEPLDIAHVLDRNPGSDIGESLPVPHRADAFVPLSMYAAPQSTRIHRRR